MSATLTRNWMASMEAIAETIRLQNLPEVKGNVHVQARAFDDADCRPGCYVTPTDVRTKTSTSSREDRGYGCAVTYIRGDSQSRGAKPEKTTVWEEFVNRLFHNKRLAMCLPDGDALLTSQVETPVNNEDPAISKRLQQIEGVSLVVRSWIREDR